MIATRIALACLLALVVTVEGATSVVAQGWPARSAVQVETSKAPSAVQNASRPQPFDANALARSKSAAAIALLQAQAKATRRGLQRPSATRQAAVVGTLNQGGLTAADENGMNAPSDSTGAIGPNNYVEAVNSLVAVYDRNLNRVGTPMSFADFMNGQFPFRPTPNGISDPQIEWDQQAGRWLYVAMSKDPGQNYVYFGWSKTSDPTDLANGWCHFNWGGTSDWYDAPKMGHDSTALVMGANLFDLPSGGSATFVTASVVEWKKPGTGVTTCTQPTATPVAGTRKSHLKNLDTTNTPAFAPVPSNTTDSGTSTYIVSAHDPTDLPFSPSLNIWHITYGRNGSPSWMSDGAATVPNYQVPAPATQAGGPNQLDTGDARLTQAVSRPDPDASNNIAIWTQHTVGLGNTPAEVRWYELIPATIPATHAARQVGDTFTSIFVANFNAAISPTIDGNEAGLTYNVSSSSQLVSIVVQSRLSSTPLGQMDAVAVPTIGSSPSAENDFSCYAPYGPPCRWGDYSAISPDPQNAHTLWATNALTSAPGGNAAGWTTKNFSVSTRGKPSCMTTDIAAGYYHSLAVGSDGTVWAWGADGNGQLGHGVIPNQDTPVQVYGQFGLGVLTGISSVAAGQYHSVALRASDGSVWAWGYNLDGELGNQDTSGTNQNSPVQVVVDQSGGQPLTGISSIASHNDHTLAIRRSDGSVWAWGLNSSGQLGNGRVANGYGASEVLGVGGNGFLTGIVAIAAGDSFSLAVDASGNVYAWGDDSAGQLGDNRSGVGVQSWTPIRVHGLNNVGNLGGVLAIAARSNGADALNSDHTVTAWGTGNQPQSLFPILVNNSGNTAPLANQTAVGASFNTTLTIDNDTSLWNWGDNSHGQLGDNTTTFRPNAVHVYNIGGGPSVLAGVVEATGGVGHSVALLTGGTVAAWGWNSAGQLGDNTFTDRPTAVQTAMPVAAAPTSC